MRLTKPAVKATVAPEPKKAVPPKPKATKVKKAVPAPEPEKAAPEPKPKAKAVKKEKPYEVTPFGTRVGTSAAQIDLLIIQSKGITAQALAAGIGSTVGRVLAHLYTLIHKKGLPITTAKVDGKTTYTYEPEPKKAKK